MPPRSKRGPRGHCSPARSPDLTVRAASRSPSPIAGSIHQYLLDLALLQAAGRHDLAQAEGDAVERVVAGALHCAFEPLKFSVEGGFGPAVEQDTDVLRCRKGWTLRLAGQAVHQPLG